MAHVGKTGVTFLVFARVGVEESDLGLCVYQPPPPPIPQVVYIMRVSADE